MAAALVETAAGAHKGLELGFYRQEKEKRRPGMEIRKWPAINGSLKVG
jgi:hypothetical protein